MAAVAVPHMPRTTQPVVLTQLQRLQLCRAFLARKEATDDGWVRARTHGERVTLASLYYRHLLMRRCHSGAGTTSPAHEYKLEDGLYRSMYDAVLAKQVARNEVGMYRANGHNDPRSGMSAAEQQETQAPGAAGGAAGAATGANEVQPDPKPGGGKAKSKGRAKPKPGGKPKPRGKASGAKPAATASGKPRTEKTSKEAKAARAKMDAQKPGYKTYNDAQVAKAKALAAGDEKEAAKQQKIMDKNRAAYTAHRAAYREYQAAPA